MQVPSPSSDITKALVCELKTLRERHTQLQSRVKAVNEAARARDEEARKQNALLTERIISLEKELRRAKESLEAGTLFMFSNADNAELIDYRRSSVSSANYSLK